MSSIISSVLATRILQAFFLLFFNHCIQWDHILKNITHKMNFKLRFKSILIVPVNEHGQNFWNKLLGPPTNARTRTNRFVIRDLEGGGNSFGLFELGSSLLCHNVQYNTLFCSSSVGTKTPWLESKNKMEVKKNNYGNI